MPSPNNPPPQAAREIKNAIDVANTSTVELALSVCARSYAVASMAIAVLVLTHDPSLFLLITSWVVIAGCVVNSVWMKYTIIHTLGRSVHWRWWAWLATLLVTTIIDTTIDL